MFRLLRTGLALVLLSLACAVRAAVPVPAEAGFLVDQTGIIEPAHQVELQVRLAQYLLSTGRKIVVLMVETTEGEDLEVFADRVGTTWALDQVQDGSALLLWTAEGYILIRAWGPALDRLHADVQSDILTRWVIPAFGRGEGSIGIRDGAERMIAVLDGGEVGFPSGAEAVDAADAAAESPMSDVASGIPEAEPMPLPTWFAVLPGELARLGQGLHESLPRGLSILLSEARTQSAQLQVRAQAALLQFQGEQVEPPLAPISLNAFVVCVAAFGIGGLLLLRRAFVPALGCAGAIGGAALWVATGFTALALLLIVIGLSAPLLVRVLRAVLSGSDDEEREPVASLSNRMATPGPRSSVPVRAPATRAARPVERTIASGARIGEAACGEALRKLASSAAQEAARSLKTLHLVVFVILAAIHPLLAVLAGIVFAARILYRSGLAWLLADQYVEDRELRARLKRRLPPPPN